MEKRYLIIFLGILVLVGLLVSGAGCGETPSSGNQSQENATGPKNCTQDSSCLKQNFISCQPAVFSMPFGENNTYDITVYGIENNTCHFKTSAMGRSSDCFYPLNETTNAAFAHFFGQDKTGTECLSEACKYQENLNINNCQSTF